MKSILTLATICVLSACGGNKIVNGVTETVSGVAETVTDVAGAVLPGMAETETFACQNGIVFERAYLGNDQISLTSGQAKFVLAAAVSGSGERYADNQGNQWHEKAGEAYVELMTPAGKIETVCAVQK